MNFSMSVNNRKNMIYLDNAATTKIDDRVLEAMMPYLTSEYGNASSIHSLGTSAKEVLKSCKDSLSRLINCDSDEIVFTSGGTESNNFAIKGIAFANRDKGTHIIVSSIEHECILNACKWLEGQGFYITYLPVDNFGFVNVEKLARYINPKTILVSVMHANNEIGTIQDIEEIGKICREKNIYFHSDACQSFGKIPLDVQKCNLDLLTLNAHKVHGPKGVGALFVRKGVKIDPLLHGGGQESGLRSSTENIAGIVGFTKAAQIAFNEIEIENKRLSGLRDKIIHSILNNIEGAYINGHPVNRLPANISFSVHGFEGEAMRLLLLLDEEGISISGGSACSSNSSDGSSHVLKAIGKDQFEARGAIRISLGRFNTEAEIDIFLNVLLKKIKQLNPIFT